jgi:hypothetical protein
MPISKHIKKNQTARQFRKKRNLRRAVAQAQSAREKRSFLSAAKIVEEQANRAVLDNVEAQHEEEQR